MDISVVVVAYNEEENIGACLKALLAQDFAGTFEIIVVDGGSTDGTFAAVRALTTDTSKVPVRLVHNAKKCIAPGRNAGIRESLAEYIAFTDADCRPQPRWLAGLIEAFRACSETDSSVAAVGGANVPPAGSNDFHEALGLFLDSALGSFNSAQGRVFSSLRKVASLSCTNVLYRKSTLIAVGGFDEALCNMSEDCDLNMRLGRRGHSLYFVPGLSVEHLLRRDEASWFRNMAAYGRGRALVTFKNNDFLNPFFLAPSVFALSYVCVPFSFIHPAFLVPFAYLPLITAYAWGVCAKAKKSRLFPRVLRLFIGTHLCYAFALFFSTVRIIGATLLGRGYRPAYGFRSP
jgi:GT2 family glycosyltransferase